MIYEKYFSDTSCQSEYTLLLSLPFPPPPYSYTKKKWSGKKKREDSNFLVFVVALGERLLQYALVRRLLGGHCLRQRRRVLLLQLALCTCGRVMMVLSLEGYI